MDDKELHGKALKLIQDGPLAVASEVVRLGDAVRELQARTNTLADVDRRLETRIAEKRLPVLEALDKLREVVVALEVRVTDVENTDLSDLVDMPTFEALRDRLDRALSKAANETNYLGRELDSLKGDVRDLERR